MIKKIVNITKIVMTFLLICATFYHGYGYLNGLFRTEDANYNDSFHNLPENSLDVIVLGSSHAQYSFVPSFFYQNTGLYSYVLGSACQPLKVSYEMLKEALKTQNPEMVILEVYTATPLREWCEGDSCFVLAEYQMRGEEKQNVIGMLPSEKAEMYRNDFVTNHNNWRTVGSIEDLYNNKKKDFIDPAFGFVCLEVNLPVENYWYPTITDSLVDVELDDEDLGALNNIYNLCQSEDIKLMLYMAPMDGLDELNQSYRYKVWDWAIEHEVDYVDFVKKSRELDYRMQIHNDGAHSSINGSGIITDYLSDRIMNRFVFERHANNELLDERYNKYLASYSGMVLKTEHDPFKYMRRLIRNPGIVIMKYNGNDDYISEDFKRFLFDMGMTDDFSSFDKYHAVFSNGELLCFDKDKLEVEVNDNSIVVDKNIAINGETIKTNGEISLAILNENFENLIVKNIRLNGEIWDYEYDHHYNRILR